MKKNLIIVVLALLIFVSPTVAGDLGFKDFMSIDPVQDLKDIGVWGIVVNALWFLVILLLVAVVAGLIIQYGKGKFHKAANNSSGRTDAMIGMFFILAAVLVMVIIGGTFIYIWNGLT